MIILQSLLHRVVQNPVQFEDFSDFEFAEFLLCLVGAIRRKVPPHVTQSDIPDVPNPATLFLGNHPAR